MKTGRLSYFVLMKLEAPPKKYLVVKLRTLGDTVMSTAFVSQLKKLQPNCVIDFVSPKAWAPALEGHPDIDKVIPLDFSKKDPLRLLKIFQLGLRLRKENYDAAFALHASSSSAWLLVIAGIKMRIVHNHLFNGPKLFSSLPIPDSDKLHPALMRDALCLKAMGWKLKDELKTSIASNEIDRQWSERYLKKHNLKKPLLVLGITASRETKMWPQENFALLAKKWIETKKGSVLALHASNESKYAHHFLNEAKKLNILSRLHTEGHASIKELISLIKEAELFIGNDSGPKHLAVALDVPTITFFGPEDPFEYHPYDLNKHKIMFIENLNCRTNLSPQGDHPWCGIHVCDKEQLKCLRGIHADSVNF